MNQLWAWEYERKTEVGWRHGERLEREKIVAPSKAPRARDVLIPSDQLELAIEMIKHLLITVSAGMTDTNEEELSAKTKDDLMQLAERLEDQAFSWDITEEALEITKTIVADMRERAKP